MKIDRKCKPPSQNRTRNRLGLLLATCAVILAAGEGSAQLLELSDNAGRSAGPVRAAPLRATFRLRLQGFVVERQTWDDTDPADGPGDEVYLVYNADTVDLSGRDDTRRTSNWGVITATHGHPRAGEGTVPAGSATAHGGLRTGDRFPPAPWPAEPRGTGSAIFEAELIQGRTAGIVIPAIFESDRLGEIAVAYNRAVFASRTAVQNAVAALVRGRALTTAEQILRRGETLGLDGLTSSVLHGNGFTGERGDRPVGMVPPPPGRSAAVYTFVPQGLVLTYEAASAIVRNDLFGAGRGVVVVRYRDDARLRGEYSLYFLVDRVPASR